MTKFVAEVGLALYLFCNLLPRRRRVVVRYFGTKAYSQMKLLWVLGVIGQSLQRYYPSLCVS